jgi:hypothetical protein
MAIIEHNYWFEDLFPPELLAKLLRIWSQIWLTGQYFRFSRRNSRYHGGGSTSYETREWAPGVDASATTNGLEPPAYTIAKQLQLQQ